MKRSGRVSIVGLLGIVAIVALASLLFITRESLGSIGGRFMTALAKGDVEQLTKLSYIEGRSPDQLREAWRRATEAGKHYMFHWRISDSIQPSDDTGSVIVMVERNVDTMMSYEEKFQLPMVRVNGEWKVRANTIPRGMYPALPR